MTMTRRLDKLETRATIKGQQYEYLLAALVKLRARRVAGLQFDLATNVVGAEPCDDILLRLRWEEEGQERCLTYLVQLKYNRNRNLVDGQGLRNDKGDFSIKKYFEVYKRLAGIEEKESKGGAVNKNVVSEGNKEYLMATAANDYRFIIFTTKKFKRPIVADKPNSSETGKSDTGKKKSSKNRNVAAGNDNSSKIGKIATDERNLSETEKDVTDEHNSSKTGEVVVDKQNSSETGGDAIDKESSFETGKVATDKHDSSETGNNVTDEQISSTVGEVVTDKHNSSEIGGTEFPFCELFSPDKKDMGFSFTPADTVVWNLLADDKDEEMFRKEFLPRLRMYGDQESPEDLERRIIQEIEALLELGKKGRTMAQEYILKASKWWESDEGDMWTNETHELEEIIQKDITSTFDKDTKKECIEFCSESFQEIFSSMRQSRLTFVSVPGCKYSARCLKVKQAIEFHFGESKMLPLCYNTIQHMSNAILESAGILGEDDFVLVNTEKRSPTTSKELIQQVLLRTPCKVVVVISDSNESDAMTDGIDAEFGVFEDVWQLSQLTPASQDELLGRKVRYQSQEVELKSLEKFWHQLKEDVDAPLMCALLTGKATLDDASHEGANDYFMQRVLEHKAVLRREVLHLAGEKFVLAGFPNDVIEEIRAERPRLNQTVESGNEMWEILPLKEGSRRTEEEKRAFDEIVAKNPSVNTHHVSYSNGSLVWMKTSGEVSKITPYIIPQSPHCYPSPSCTHSGTSDFGKWKGKVVLLCGGPGMGKTTFLKELAKSETDSGWSVYIPLVAHAKLLQSMPQSGQMTVKDVLDLLEEAVGAKRCSSSHSTRAFLGCCLMFTGDITVYLDGVDEIHQDDKDKVLRLIQLLNKSQVSRIWITSRMHVKNDIQKCVPCEPLYLRPFSEREQVDYVCHQFAQRSGRAEDNEMRERIARVVRKVCESTEHDGASISSVPLHSNILARVLCGTLGLPQQGGNFTLLKLYQEIVSSKRQIYEKKLGFGDGNIQTPILEEARRRFLEVHEQCALLTVTELQELRIVNVDRRPNFQDEYTGIMVLRDSVPHFVHYSFAEYFAAHWLNSNAGHMRAMAGAWQRLSPTLRYFLDALLAEGRPLHEALIAGGAPVANLDRAACAERDRGGRSPLHLAAIYGNAEACRALIEAGCDISAEDAVLGWTALQYADAALDVTALDALLAAGGPKPRLEKLLKANAHGGEQMREAARNGQLNILNYFLQAATDKELPEEERRMCCNDRAGDRFHLTPLHLAARFAQPEAVKLLLDVRGTAVDPRSKVRRTPLHLASLEGHEEIVQELIARGAAVNSPAKDGYSALHFAAEKGQYRATHVLISNGANANAANALGWTPLHVACHYGHRDLAKALLQAQARVDAPGQELWTPLHHAAHKGRDAVVAMLLADFHASVDSVNAKGYTPLHLAAEKGNYGAATALLSAGADPNAATNAGWTPLHYAASKGRHDLVRLLLSRPSSTEARGKGGVSALHLAAQEGHTVILRDLVARGANVQAVSDNGATPLHLAAQKGRASAVEALLNAGADVGVTDNAGNTAAQCAASHGHQAVAALLERH